MNPHPDTHFVQDYQPGNDACVELKNGRFVDVLKGCYFDPGVSVILKGGKIHAMPGLPGESDDMSPDFTIDLKGKTVIPGLFNTHSHIQLTLPSMMSGMKDILLNKKYGERQIINNMAECLARGITNIRDAWTEDLRMNRALQEKISRGDIPGPRIVQAVLVSPLGGAFAPKRGFRERMMFSLAGMPFIDYENTASGVVAFPPDASEQEVRDAVDKAIDERGADCIKIYEQREKRLSYESGATVMSLDQLQALTDQARRRSLMTTMHHLTVDSFRRGVQAGVSSFAHLPYDAELTVADVKAFKNAGCMIEPTISMTYYLCLKIKGDPYYDHPQMDRLTQLRNQTYTSLAGDYWIPELKQSVIQGLEKANQGKMRMLGWLDMSHIFRYYSGLIAHGVENFRRLFEQGACVACANDAGAVPSTEAMIGHELEMFDFFLNGESAEKPFGGADALLIATINSARAMGREDRFGSIETGKIADLVVFEDDPLENFGVIGNRAAAVFMDGKLVINNCGLRVEAVKNK